MAKVVLFVLLIFEPTLYYYHTRSVAQSHTLAVIAGILTIMSFALGIYAWRQNRGLPVEVQAVDRVHWVAIQAMVPLTIALATDTTIFALGRNGESGPTALRVLAFVSRLSFFLALCWQLWWATKIARMARRSS